MWFWCLSSIMCRVAFQSSTSSCARSPPVSMCMLLSPLAMEQHCLQHGMHQTSDSVILLQYGYQSSIWMVGCHEIFFISFHVYASVYSTIENRINLQIEHRYRHKCIFPHSFLHTNYFLLSEFLIFLRREFSLLVLAIIPFLSQLWIISIKLSADTIPVSFKPYLTNKNALSKRDRLNVSKSTENDLQSSSSCLEVSELLSTISLTLPRLLLKIYGFHSVKNGLQKTSIKGQWGEAMIYLCAC